jgi:hypothetical protein
VLAVHVSRRFVWRSRSPSLTLAFEHFLSLSSPRACGPINGSRRTTRRLARGASYFRG